MKSIPILLVPAVLCFIVFIFAQKKSSHGFIDAIARGHVVLFAFIAFSTEILSLFGRLNTCYVISIWSIVCLLLLYLLFSIRRVTKVSEPPNLPSKYFISGLAVIGFFLLATLLACLLYPPNNWDSMTYHMSRVANWINNGNVQFYPTAIDRQLYQMPLAEFAILHCQLLSGSDLFANVDQWVCFAVSVGSVALIAKELGLSRNDQMLTSLVFTTIPMAILQASSTQNDLVVTSFLLTFALFMLRMRTECNWTNGIFASLSLGLAFLTKGTAWIFAPPLGLLLALPILKPARSDFSLLTRRVGLLSLVVMFALAINSGHFYRSYELYGRPIASGSDNYFCKDLTGPAAIGNIARNLALHLGTPSIHVNCYLNRITELALGEQLNNPSNTWPDTFFKIRFSLHEDVAGNPIHALLVIFSVVSAFVWMRRQQLATNCYVVGTFIAGIFYCVFLQWQPWASRLHTPVFALFAPIIVIAVREVLGRKLKYFGVVVISLMYVFSVQFAVYNWTRPLLSSQWLSKSRAELYFVNRPGLYRSYLRVMNIVNMYGLREVGLCLGGDDWEYPFWVLQNKGTNFHHVCVNNPSRELDSRATTPAYILATREPEALKELRKYHVEYADNNVKLLIKNGHNNRLHSTANGMPFALRLFLRVPRDVETFNP